MLGFRIALPPHIIPGTPGKCAVRVATAEAHGPGGCAMATVAGDGEFVDKVSVALCAARARAGGKKGRLQTVCKHHES